LFSTLFVKICILFSDCTVRAQKLAKVYVGKNRNIFFLSVAGDRSIFTDPWIALS